MRKCQRCEVAPAVHECLECANRDELTPVQLCLECSGIIHVGRLASHTPTPTKIAEKRQVIEEKLKIFCRQTQGLTNKRHDIKAAKKDMQEQMRLYERNLRRTVQELQAMLKDRARDLFMQMKSDANTSLVQLDECDATVHQHLLAIKEVSSQIEAVIMGDDDIFEEAYEGLQEKLEKGLHDCQSPNVPNLQSPPELQLTAITAAINSLSLTQPSTDEAFRMPQLEMIEGTTMNVYVSGRMTRDGTFWVMPDLAEEALQALDRINSTIRKNYIQNLKWQTFEDEGTSPAVGDHVYVLFSNDNKWYRARVEETKSDGSCQVVYMDYGNIEVVGLNSMLPIVEDLFPDCPYQAVECSIFSELRSDLNMTVRWTFSDLVQDVPCECQFVSKWSVDDRNIWQVELQVEQDNGKVNLNDVVKAKAEDQKKNMGSIQCRDIRLMDNPEVFSKLTTVAIERPKETAAQRKEETAASSNDSSKVEPAVVTQVDDAEHLAQGPSANGIDKIEQAEPPQPEDSSAPTDSPPADSLAETGVEELCEDKARQAEDHISTAETEQLGQQSVNNMVNRETCVEEETMGYQPERPDRTECEVEEEVELVESRPQGDDVDGEQVRTIPADSPSFEEYQSATSSLGDSSEMTAISSSSESTNRRKEAKDEHVTIGTDSLNETDVEHVEWSPREISVETEGGKAQESPNKSSVDEETASDASSPKEKDREATKENIKKKGKKKRKDSGSTDKKPVEKPAPPEQECQNDEPFNPEEWLAHCGQQPEQRSRIEARISKFRDEEMNTDVVKVTPSVSCNICPGATVIALGERDTWHRAIITDVSGRKVDVHFMDFPKSRNVYIDSLKYLPPKIRNLPPCCKLPKYVRDLVIGYCGDQPNESDQHISQTPRPILGQEEMEIEVEPEPVKSDQHVNQYVQYTHGNQLEVHEDQGEPRLSAFAPPFVPRHAAFGSKSSTGRNRGGKKGDGRSGRGGCYLCGQQGHIKMDCPSNQPDGASANGAPREHDRSAGGCYGCGELGHIRAECPNERRDGGQRSSRDHRHYREDRGYGKHRHYGNNRSTGDGDWANGAVEMKASQENWDNDLTT